MRDRTRVYLTDRQRHDDERRRLDELLTAEDLLHAGKVAVADATHARRREAARMEDSERYKRLRNAAIIATAILVAGLGLDASDWLGTWGIWDDPGDTTTVPGAACTAPSTPTVTAVPTDTSVTALGSAFSDNCTSGSDTHASSDWWVTGPLPSAPNDTVAVFLASDSLERYTNLATTLATDSTYVLHGRYNGSVGGASGEAVDTFVAELVTVDTVYFGADFDSLGTSQYALRDSSSTTPFTNLLDNDNLLEVVAAPSSGACTGFPSANAMKIHLDDGGTGQIASAQPWVDTTQTYWPVPGVGDTLGIRYYWCQMTPDNWNDDPLWHGWQDGPQFGDRSWQDELVTATNGTYTYRPRFTNGLSNNVYPNNGFFVTLDKETVYRLESIRVPTSSTAFEYHVRVYNSAGALLFSDADFDNMNSSGTLADISALNAGSIALRSMGGFRTGMNSSGAGVSAVDSVFAYMGAIAVCAGWCGAYVDGEDPN